MKQQKKNDFIEASAVDKETEISRNQVDFAPGRIRRKGGREG
jgi:hypothetical protein